MSERMQSPAAVVPVQEELRCLGVVVHPVRNIEPTLRAVSTWTARHHVDLLQLPVAGQHREVAEFGQPSDCDLILSIGGDGTTLAAIRAGAAAGRPVLGVACGSLGALTTVPATRITQALDRLIAHDWSPRLISGLDIALEDQPRLFAINDLAIVRAGEGQIRLIASVDGTLFARLAGDGCIVSTPLGSSAYTLAAGGPLLEPGIDAYIFTPLATHGGTCPPLVLSADSKLSLKVAAGYGGARLELDGQIADAEIGSITVTLRPGVATLVSFDGEESILTGLRRRQIITDSPRMVIEQGHC